MKRTILRSIPALTICVLLISCSKDYTNYFDDAEDPGLAIFSNTGNNLMTCYVDGKPWRTQSRKGYLLGGIDYEVNVAKRVTNTAMDTIEFTWNGYPTSDKQSNGTITFLMPVAKTFSLQDFSQLEGKRLSINGTNGFFTASIPGLNTANTRGTGDIYFLRAKLDSSLTQYKFSGTLSGIFRASFGNFTIEKGRFDHELTKGENLLIN